MRGWNHLEKESLAEYVRTITDALYLQIKDKAVDSEKLDGLQPSVGAVANTIVQRNSLGYVHANFFNTNPNDVASGITKVCVETGNDGFIRHGTPGAIRAFISFNPASYLPIGGKAADSNLLDGLDSAAFLRSNAKAVDSLRLNGAVKAISSGANTIAQRDGSGDINARLFRSEYDATNASIGFIMTQINTGSNNYIRPSTPAQFRAAVTDSVYLAKGGKAADSDKLDGLQPSVGAVANTIVQRHSSGYVYANFFNTNPNDVGSGITKVCVETGNDGFIRHGTPGAIRAFIGFNPASYLPIGGKAADSNLLDGLDSAAFLRSNAADTFSGTLTWHRSNTQAIMLQNASYPGHYLSLGGWTSANSNNISRIRNSSSNLHIDSAANGHIYLNHYSTGNVYVRRQPVWHAGNFNPASYLPVGGTAVNAQKLDSIDSSQFLRSDVADTAAGRLVFTSSMPANKHIASGTSGGLEIRSSGSGSNAGAAVMAFHRPGAYAFYFGMDTDNQLKVGGWSMGGGRHKIWHQANDGHGSGLDADLWDGWQRDTYLNQPVRTNSSPTFTNLYTNSWYRVNGNGGIYWQNHAGGWNMQDSTWLRTYNNKRVLMTNTSSATSPTSSAALRVFGGIAANGTSFLNALKTNNFQVLGQLECFGTTAYIDFNNVTGVDRNARIQVSGGTSAANSGVMTLEARHIMLSCNEGAVNRLFYDNRSGTVNFGLGVSNSNNYWIQTFNKGSNTFRQNIMHFNEGEIGYYKPLVNRSSKHTKTVVGTIKNCLAMIKRLKPILFCYNNDCSKRILPGFEAEDVPEQMHLTHGKGANMMLNYIQMVAWVVGAIKELSAKIEEIEKKLSHEYSAQTT